MSATGVKASTSYLKDEGIARGPGSEVLVDEGLQALSPTAHGVFAAGDCCQVCFQEDRVNDHGDDDGVGVINKMKRDERHWFQMKLWSQVRPGS